MNAKQYNVNFMLIRNKETIRKKVKKSLELKLENFEDNFLQIEIPLDLMFLSYSAYFFVNDLYNLSLNSI